jgi:hypothetical protein
MFFAEPSTRSLSGKRFLSDMIVLLPRLNGWRVAPFLRHRARWTLSVRLGPAPVCLSLEPLRDRASCDSIELDLTRYVLVASTGRLSAYQERSGRVMRPSGASRKPGFQATSHGNPPGSEK